MGTTVLVSCGDGRLNWRFSLRLVVLLSPWANRYSGAIYRIETHGNVPMLNITTECRGKCLRNHITPVAMGTVGGK